MESSIYSWIAAGVHAELQYFHKHCVFLCKHCLKYSFFLHVSRPEDVYAARSNDWPFYVSPLQHWDFLQGALIFCTL